MQFEELIKWVAGLKPGDEVTIENNQGMVSILKVDRVTATQVIISVYRFRRKDGRQIGSETWRPRTLRPTTQADRDRIECSRLRSKLDRRIKDTASLEQLRAMWAIVQPGGGDAHP